MSWEGMGKPDKEEQDAETNAPIVKPPDQLFKPAKEVKQRAGVKVAVHGRPKVGKTHFALTFPEPIYIIDTQFGVAPLLEHPQFKDKNINVLSVYEEDPVNFEADPAMCIHRIDEAVTSLKSSGMTGGTIILDDVTDVWKWVQGWMRVEILKLDPGQRVKQQWDWMYANAKYQNLIMKLLSVPCNLVLNAQDHQAYESAGSPVDKWGASWQKQTPFWVDVTVQLVGMFNKDTQAMKYFGRIEAARGEDRTKKSLVGVTFDNPNYTTLMEELRKGGRFGS